ncbi:pyridine nucleotide-disulfide oxidoreductase [Candidatus Acetothermia bacterium]|nr:MAG: pyridine nucleotide-disulfide oxidoreductase [Candidatus Acetothermia bacterium]
MRKVDLAIVGAGPAGLAAAIEGAKRGCSTLVLDMNPLPGGQLVKQIHKFFGSQEHRAGTRGIEIAAQLLHQAETEEVEVMLGAEVYAIHDRTLEVAWAFTGDSSASSSGGGATPPSRHLAIAARRIILATGGAENALNFPGWTLPGVMGAGAAQTMSNVWRVLPGERILMVGAGNVGLIVSYQLLQAGAEVVAVIEAAPRIGGYGVHAAKIRRAGVPILTSHTVVRAEGRTQVEKAVIARVDSSWQPVPGSERELDVDTICIAVGLRPNARLASLAGCCLHYSPRLGGWVPIHNSRMETTIPGIYVAGDLSGVEEASTALEEGRLAGICAASSLGKSNPGDDERIAAIEERLISLRSGPFCQPRQDAKQELIEIGEVQCCKE